MKYAFLLGLAACLFACDDDDDNSKPDINTNDAATHFDEGSDSGTPAVELSTALFELSEDAPQTPLGAIPWPSDLYRNSQGALDLRLFDGTLRKSLARVILEDLEAETEGFGTSATMYLRLDGPAHNLPTSAESIEPTSTLQIVDIDPDSPSRGSTYPIIIREIEEPTQLLAKHTLAVRLVEGFTLRPNTKHALILTTAAANPSENFEKTLSETRPDGVLGKAWDLHAPLRNWLSTQSNPPKIATASVFTTSDPSSELFKLRDYLFTLQSPEIITVEDKGEREGRPDPFELYTGTYEAPRFQQGEIPYNKRGDGGIRFDEAGEPIVSGYETLRFGLSLPLGEMPENGWPVVIFAHGTGGNYLSFISNEVADFCAAQKMAVLSMDQIHHGTRANCTNGDYSSCVSLLFFNFTNPIAARDNLRQSALDLVSLMRLARNFTIPAEKTHTGTEVKLDPENVFFMGHSQGGLNGPLFLAVEPTIRGGVLSGSGADLAISLEQKKSPVDIGAWISLALGMGAEKLDRWNPALMLLQTFIEPGDAINYARFWFAEPKEGFVPKSIFMTSGLEDLYTPPETALALAAAGHVPIVGEVLKPIDAYEFTTVPCGATPPISRNVANGQAAAGFAQSEDGDHYVVFRDRSMRRRYINFLKSLIKGNLPTIY